MKFGNLQQGDQERKNTQNSREGGNGTMKRTVLLLILGMAAAVAPLSTQAADTDSISVTVSLQEVISVSVTPGAWNIGPIALGGSTAATSFTATVGNTTTTVEILATNATGGWVVGPTAGLNQYVVSVTNPALTLTNAYQTLATSLVAYGSQEFLLTYSAPTADNKGAGVDQSFAVTLRASTPVP
jgi:hypothetical protein